MKKVSEELRYDGATIEQVHEMLADPQFRERVCESQGYIRHTVQVERDGGVGMTVSIDQIQAAHHIPGFARKFVGDEIHIVQTEDWTSKEKGNIHVTIPGKPGEMSGSGRLDDSGGPTVHAVSLDIKVGIPLVGGKIEGLISDLLLKALKAENKVGRDYLSR